MTCFYILGESKAHLEHVGDPEPGVGRGLAVDEAVELGPEPRLHLVHLPRLGVALIGRQEAYRGVQASSLSYQLPRVETKNVSE